MKKLLILDDNLTICLMLKSWLVKQNYIVDTAASVEEAKQKVKNEAYDLILSDIRMPDADGFSFLSWVKKFDSGILVVMMTSYADIETAVESIKSGAVDYIAKPIEAEVLYKKIADALKNQEKQKKTALFRGALVKPPEDYYIEVYNKLNEIIHNDYHVLLIGEQGTGKTTLANYIYSRNGFETTPFVTLDLDNLSSEHKAYEPIFMQALETAKGGILLIKNLQKTDLNFQALLLKALSTQDKKDDKFTQIIVTTQEKKDNLSSMLLPKLADLLLNSYIELPALEGRNDAITVFAEHFLEMANQELDKKIKRIDSEVFEEFFKHSWDGNIQELKNMIFKACLLTEGKTISKSILPVLFKKYSGNGDADTFVHPQKQVIEGLKKENYEKEKIIEALEIAKGNKTVAASILNIDRKTLYNKIKLYKVEVN